MSRTKIVATIGPASDNEETIAKLLESGMTVARVNFSHGDRHSVTRLVQMLRKVAAATGHPLAILGDLQGPKLRIGKVPDDAVQLRIGQQVILSADPEEDDPRIIPFPHPELIDSIQQGARLVLGDGELELKVMARQGMRLYCASTLEGVLGSRKGVNLPGTFLPIPSITEKDKRDLDTAIDLGMDFIALSFVRQASDIDELRELIRARGSDLPIIAKIEKSEAIDNLEAIRDVADGMMVARGDLGIDLPAYQIPFLQKRIIRCCNEVGKPVITATQMLQSMVENPVPTRAEATDVANAILDGTDAVMLSAETASGKFPVKSVMMMHSIAQIAEEEFPYNDWNRRRSDALNSGGDSSTADAISSATVAIAHILKVDAIVTTTVSGYTARQVARYRPRQQIIALTPLETTRRRLNLVWGVRGVQVPRFGTIDEMVEDISMTLTDHGFKHGDRIVITAGVPFGRRGLTNMVQVHDFTEEDFNR